MALQGSSNYEKATHALDQAWDAITDLPGQALKRGGRGPLRRAASASDTPCSRSATRCEGAPAERTGIVSAAGRAYAA
jgi:hypothetical protein